MSTQFERDGGNLVSKSLAYFFYNPELDSFVLFSNYLSVQYEHKINIKWVDDLDKANSTDNLIKFINSIKQGVFIINDNESLYYPLTKMYSWIILPVEQHFKFINIKQVINHGKCLNIPMWDQAFTIMQYVNNDYT